MSHYFAYGANLALRAMATRCPGARPAGLARLEHFRLIVMRDGFASVRPSPGETVHGLLWTLTPSDVPPLDAFEEVESGLYTKVVHPVLHAGRSIDALLYVGHTIEEGLPLAGYIPAVLAAARAIHLPAGGLRRLEALAAQGTQPGRFDDPPDGGSATAVLSVGFRREGDRAVRWVPER